MNNDFDIDNKSYLSINPIDSEIEAISKVSMNRKDSQLEDCI